MNAHDLVQEIIERKGKIENVFWIACGGSMIDLMPANELLKREATTFTSTVYTAREFCLMVPKSLGEKSLVIACSHSGNTQEVVDGCEMALAAGAEVVALTDCEGSKIDNGKWTTCLSVGRRRAAGRGAAGHRRLMAAELLDQQEGYEALADMYAGLKQMDALLPAAREKVNAELGDRFAELCQQHKFFYILGSGPNFSQTYAMAICSLMEMQWQHCCYIHSGEYFHGPFEATEPGVFYFVQLGSGECRPMEERALAFLNTHTDTVMVLDALEYGVGDVPASVRSFLEPIFFYNMSCELRAARGKVFDTAPRFVATWVSSSTRHWELSFLTGFALRAGPFCVVAAGFVSARKRSLILFREVNDLFWTPEASTFFGAKTAGKS